MFAGANAGYSTNTGNYNTFVGGINSGYFITTGSKNTILGNYTGNNGGLDIRTANNYIVLSDGDGNPRGVFNNNGQYMVGTVAPIYSNADLVHFYGRVSGGNQYGLMIGGDAASYTCYGLRFLTNNSGNVVGSVTFSTTATTYNTSSDYRLKNITGPVTGAEAKAFIMALEPEQGTWKADGSKFVGFVAHKFQAVSPTSVTGTKDAVDEDGNPVMQAMQASSPEVMANLVALVQTLVTENESLKARLDAANL
ncbi:MAG: hypothetical protein EB117_18180 [Betaproteobacteria bacterium]|nr:hypothetical protein [Betaproteobacteria bacterium]